MAKNRKTKKNGRKNEIQIIYSEKQYILKERYLTKKGKRLITELREDYANNLNSKEYIEKSMIIWNKYGKNRYELNPNAYPVKTIKTN